MNKESLIELTKKIYQITILFPKKEPLRYKTREVANDILTDFIKAESHSILSVKDINSLDWLIYNLDIMDAFLDIADAQNWAIPAKLLPVWDDYIKMRDFIREKKKSIETKPKQEKKEKQENEEPKKESNVRASSRQEKIIKMLKENGQAQVGEFKDIFPDVTKRTLRRDFRFLLKQGTIERIGEKNNTFYKIKSQELPVALLSE